MELTNLTNRQIAARAPAAFAKEAHESRTERYGFVPTMQIVDALRSEGFLVTAAEQETVRRGSMRDAGHTRHMIKLAHPGCVTSEGHAQFLLDNSHNGVSGLKATMGFFRFVCSNGLVIGTALHAEAIRHTTTQAADAIERIRRLAANTAPMFERIEKWQRRSLTRSQEFDFAKAAMELRFGEGGAERYDPAAVIAARREEDAARTMWAVLNRVQENLVRPTPEFVGAAASGRRIRARGLSGINSSLAFNTALWDLAEEFAA